MPYLFYKEPSGVKVEFEGTYSFSDNNQATVELYDHPEFSELKYIIWDFTGVSRMEMTPVETDIASMMDKEASSRLPHTKVALITQDPFTRQLCQSYIADCGNRKLEWDFLVADTLEQARKWIDV